MNDMNADTNIKGGELLTATYLSIPLFNQTGTKIIAPPSPKAPPTTPAMCINSTIRNEVE